MNAFNEAQLVPALQALAATFGHIWRPQQLDGYVTALADLPVERVLDALDGVTRTEKFFPKPAVIRERASLSRVPVTTTTRPLTPSETWTNPDTGTTEQLYRCACCEDTGWVPIARRADAADGLDPRPLAGGRVLRWTEVRAGERHSCVRRCECRRSA